LKSKLPKSICSNIGSAYENLGEYMKISARNMLKGKVKMIIPGSVNSEITIELPGGQEITSIITKKSVENLGLSVGKTAYAVIKSSEVMIAID
jgi:molybdopterin-binding protein